MQNREKLYRDNVHKDIKLDAFTTAIIDAPEFQRLDGIKQLGFAELVYRGAKHSRFEHSIGAYWLARQIMQLIPLNHERLGIPFLPPNEFHECLGSRTQLIDNLTRIVSYASLLHDITHIPFGHTLEDEFQGIFKYKHDDLESPRLPYILFDPRSGISQVFKRREPWLGGLSNDNLAHLLAIIITYRDEVGKPGYDKELERPFEEIINEKIAYQRRLQKDSSDRISGSMLQYWEDLLTWYIYLRQNRLYHPFMTDIVANTICSDILDYVRRDVYGTGLGMDFDHRIFQYFVIGREVIRGGSSWRLALCIRDPRKGIDKIDIASEVLNILSLRYSLAERVYYHKSKVSAGAMLAKALSLVGNPPEPNFGYPPTTQLSQDDTYTEREKHVLAVDMTDDGFLCWLDEKAVHTMEEFRPTPPIVTKGELTKIKSDSSAQLAMEAEDGAAIVDTDINGSSISPGNRARVLLRNLRERKLYKPAAIITYDIARRERRPKYFTTKYHKRQDCEQFEKELALKLGLDEGNLVIYCPRPQPQIKQMETRVLTKGTIVQPLWDDDRFKSQASNIAVRYERLWKLFLFLRSEEFNNPLTRQMVTEEFHRFEKFKKVEARELAPYPWLEDEQKAAWQEYSSSSSTKDAQLWHPSLGELIEDSQSWELVKSLGNGKKVSTNLILASAALFLYDFEVEPNRFGGQRKPAWLGLETILKDSPLKERLFKNLNWKGAVEAQLLSLNRDRGTIDETTLVRESYYSVFRKWNEEIGIQ